MQPLTLIGGYHNSCRIAYNVTAQRQITRKELKEGIEGARSWHHQYKDSAYIYIGGLHDGLTEGDVVVVFSQFGEIVDCHMVRDRSTGKSKGFAFVCYDDQRSTVLAVDNMNGYQLLKRTLRVDHIEKFKAPKEFDENDLDAEGNPKLLEYKASGAEGKGYQVYNVLESQKKIVEAMKQKKKYWEDKAATEAPEDEDEAWARSFEENLVDLKEAEKERKRLKKLKKDKKELKRMKKEAKKLKKEAKKVKKETKDTKKKTEPGGKVKKEAKKEAKSESDSSDSDSDS
ncbi:RNA-binding motif protein, X-linked 2 [Symbiodinium microadriaticum]|uniref:RNA-binding motif protein, X-linked 2 n=1 Tax=Symbiodinium microadriaticum TaxID=2951 RepID=A0A1Q9EF69_SYMMI|nr:RNA-binding motif protein, X-linked 2 [Symbiodinium microadriaticum]CAE7539843.1 RBMX2 [Symbiodinium sp. KB8]